MKIILITESYWPNADGGALFERRLSQGLNESGTEVVVWAPGAHLYSYQETDGQYLIEREKSVTFIVNPKYRVSYWPFWRARTLLRRHRPDVVHIMNFGFMGLAGLFWAKRYRIPVVSTNHNMPENVLLVIKAFQPLYHSLRGLVWRYLVALNNRADYVTSPTLTAVKFLTDHGLQAPSRSVSNGIDTKVFKPGVDTTSVMAKYNLAKYKHIILYLGRVDGEKRLDLLIAAVPHILASAQVVIAGFGVAEPSLKAQAQKLGVSERLSFLGFIDEADKPALYNAATVFVITSPAELQSIVTLEAMASSLPVVAVDVAALHELCRNGQNGYLFPLDQPNQLPDKLNSIIADSSRAKAFGQYSRHIVEKSHATEAMITEYSNLYKQVSRPQ